MRMRLIFIAASALFVLPAMAQPVPGTGPVATQCVEDIAKFCAGKEHGQGDIRACLQTKYSELSADCKQALDTTGPGSRRNRQR